MATSFDSEEDHSSPLSFHQNPSTTTTNQTGSAGFNPNSTTQISNSEEEEEEEAQESLVVVAEELQNLTLLNGNDQQEKEKGSGGGYSYTNNNNDHFYNNNDQGEGGDGFSYGSKFEYPLRPYAEDCAFYVKTGKCKFGPACKFNHPAKRVIEKERGDFVKKTGHQIECKYYQTTEGCKYGTSCRFSHSKEKSEMSLQDIYLPSQQEKETVRDRFAEKTGSIRIKCKYFCTPGGCKFGKTCKYDHLEENAEPEPPVLNFVGLPMRSLQKECPFYMRTGACGYGVNCIYHHPDPAAAEASSPFSSTHGGAFMGGYSSGYDNWKSDASQYLGASVPAAAPWSSEIPSNTVSHFDNHSSWAPGRSHPEEVLLKPEWSRYQAPANTQERSVFPHSSAARTNWKKTTDFSSIDQEQKGGEEFPERPGQPECNYFMKTGKCKYSYSCMYHHPKDRASEGPVLILSSKGLPLRPDKRICWHYDRYGICKYGQGCMFDHPENHVLSAIQMDSDPGRPSTSDCETLAGTALARCGSRGDGLVQQSS